MTGPTVKRVMDEMELEDELFRMAGADAYRRSIMHVIQGFERTQVIAWFLAQHPPLQRYVNDHIANGTCAAAVAELRSRRRGERQETEGVVTIFPGPKGKSA